jgi:hypothetical protein
MPAILGIARVAPWQRLLSLWSRTAGAQSQSRLLGELACDDGRGVTGIKDGNATRCRFMQSYSTIAFGLETPLVPLFLYNFFDLNPISISGRLRSISLARASVSNIMIALSHAPQMASLRPIFILALAVGAMAASDSMGPAGLMWPPDRAWSEQTDNTPPCGSAAGVGDRTEFPLSTYDP